MDAVQEILNSIPFDQLAAQVGTDPATAQQMAGQLVPALIGGMSANADDEGGARSLASALNDHTSSAVLDDRVHLDRVDTGDGDAIVHNVFGANTPQVTQRLGAQVAGGNSELVHKLLRYLAPIVLAYLAKQLTQPRGGGAEAGGRGGGILGDILDNLTGGGRSQQQPQQGPNLQDVLLDMLGGGGSGRGGARQPAPAPRSPQFEQPRQVPSGQGDSGRAPDQIPLDDPVPPARSEPAGGGGGLLGDILGGLLGGGRRN
ncbi:MAG: DUF937 domain-containing protein [Propionibacteriaceae bacterium]|nr:DUF937 domain-containing protein [Propionibacteriaceae bacterium]